MPPPQLSISKIGPESEPMLRKLFQHYLHEMAEWFEVESNPDGSYSYDTLSLWDQGYDVYLAKVDDSIAGFALIGSAAEWLGDVSVHDVHEFFVLPEFRRAGIGRQMATLLWDERPGKWLVRVAEVNAPAIPFWRTVISTYARGSHTEEPRVVNDRPWRFFRFASRGSNNLYLPPTS